MHIHNTKSARLLGLAIIATAAALAGTTFVGAIPASAAPQITSQNPCGSANENDHDAKCSVIILSDGSQVEIPTLKRGGMLGGLAAGAMFHCDPKCVVITAQVAPTRGALDSLGLAAAVDGLATVNAAHVMAKGEEIAAANLRPSTSTYANTTNVSTSASSTGGLASANANPTSNNLAVNSNDIKNVAKNDPLTINTANGGSAQGGVANATGGLGFGGQGGNGGTGIGNGGQGGTGIGGNGGSATNINSPSQSQSTTNINSPSQNTSTSTTNINSPSASASAF